MSHDIRNAWMALCAMTKRSDGGSARVALKGKVVRMMIR